MAIGAPFHLQLGEAVVSDGAVGGQDAAVQLVGGPLHDAPLHAVLHRQHCAGGLRVHPVQPLEQRT